MTSVKPTNLLKVIGKYALLFAVAYIAISWWRAPKPPVEPSQLSTTLTQTDFDNPHLLYFWGTWCGVCTITSPMVNQIHQDGYAVTTIAVQSGTPAEVTQYLQTHNYDFSVIHDFDGEIFRSWQGKVTPSFVIVKDGKVVQSFSGITPIWLLKGRLLMAKYL